MKKEWFVLQTLTGQENKVQTNIRCRVGQEQMGDYVGQCIIPMEKVTESKNGKKRTIHKEVVPGYVLVELALYDEAAGLDKDGKRVVVERTWQFLRATPGIIGSWLMQRPNPLTQAEVDAILSTKPTSSSEKPRPKVNFSVGETVKINDGAFMGLTGQISMVDPDRGKLKVEVSVFSRTVPVDVDYWQVEKVEAKAADAIEPAKS